MNRATSRAATEAAKTSNGFHCRTTPENHRRDGGTAAASVSGALYGFSRILVELITECYLIRLKINRHGWATVDSFLGVAPTNGDEPATSHLSAALIRIHGRRFRPDDLPPLAKLLAFQKSLCSFL